MDVLYDVMTMTAVVPLDEKKRTYHQRRPARSREGWVPAQTDLDGKEKIPTYMRRER